VQLRVRGTTCYEMMIAPCITLAQHPHEALIGDRSVWIGREYVTRISTSMKSCGNAHVDIVLTPLSGVARDRQLQLRSAGVFL
jgi:hypothetical protein